MAKKKRKEKVPIGEDDKIWCSVEATFNLGNYENIKLQTGRSLTLTEDDDEEEMRSEIMGQMIEEILETGDSVKEERR